MANTLIWWIPTIVLGFLALLFFAMGMFKSMAEGKVGAGLLLLIAAALLSIPFGFTHPRASPAHTPDLLAENAAEAAYTGDQQFLTEYASGEVRVSKHPVMNFESRLSEADISENSGAEAGEVTGPLAGTEVKDHTGGIFGEPTGGVFLVPVSGDGNEILGTVKVEVVPTGDRGGWSYSSLAVKSKGEEGFVTVVGNTPDSR